MATNSNVPTDASDGAKDKYLSEVESSFYWALVLGIFGILVCSVSAELSEVSEPGVFLRVFGLGLLLAGAAVMVGFIIGFLFGIPKTTDHPSSQPAPSPNPNQGNESNARSNREMSSSQSSGGRQTTSTVVVSSSVNTNLEQISDWLTKIIVGVSLVEFNKIIDQLRLFVGYMNRDMGWTAGGQYSTVIIMFYLPLGFFFGWTITRTYLATWFATSDVTRGGLTRPSIPAEPWRTLENLPTDLAQKAKSLISAGVGPGPGASTKELADYASAQMLAGHPDEAIESLDSAIEREPQNPELQVRKAVALNERGDTAGAVGLLKDVRQKTTDPITSAKIDENLVYAYLYKPGGFDQAIDLGKQLEADSKLHHTSWLYVLLACAFGQKFKALKEQGKEAEAKAARDEALAYVRKAISADSKWKIILQQLWNPRKYGSDPSENDLDGFKDDDDFKTLLE